MSSLVFCAQAWAGSLRVEVGRIEHPRFEARAVSLWVTGEQLGLATGSLTAGPQRLVNLRLDCEQAGWSVEVAECTSGRLSVPGWFEASAFSARYDGVAQDLSGVLTTPAGESLTARIDRNGRFDLNFSNLSLSRLSDHLDAVTAYAPQGSLSGRVQGQPSDEGLELGVEARLREGAFASASGMEAAEGLNINLGASVRSVLAGGWQFSLNADWQGGEAYIHPFYLESGPSVRVNASLLAEQLRVEQATLRMQGVDALEMSATLDLESRRLRAAEVSLRGVDVAQVGERFLLPALAPAWVGRLVMNGAAQARLSVRNNKLQSFDVSLNAVNLSLDEGAIELGPIDASLPWRLGGANPVRAQVGGGRWESLELGRFPVNATVSDLEASFEPLVIPLLDGRMRITDLQVKWLEEGVHGSGGLVLEPVSVELLTEALGLPTMSGVLSASLPGIRLAPGLLKLDGALVVSLFGGYVRIDKLEVREPFGLASYLAADLEARNLDLDKITHTFAFGSITGFIDADVLGLELVRWRPVAFDAHIRSSPGRYDRRISQRAVQNIGALGGGGAAVALQRGVLSFFESFGYRELGLSCRLVNEVCFMGGVEDMRHSDGSDRGFVIVRGGGVPALNVIGYNRHVNWQVLLDRLRAAIDSNEAPRFE